MLYEIKQLPLFLTTKGSRAGTAMHRAPRGNGMRTVAAGVLPTKAPQPGAHTAGCFEDHCAKQRIFHSKRLLMCLGSQGPGTRWLHLLCPRWFDGCHPVIGNPADDDISQANGAEPQKTNKSVTEVNSANPLPSIKHTASSHSQQPEQGWAWCSWNLLKAIDFCRK